MNTREKIKQLIRAHGGTYKAPEGNAGQRIASELGLSYGTVSTTLLRMSKQGELEKEAKGRRVYAYVLPEPKITPETTLERVPDASSGLLASTNGTDYYELAGSILRRVAHIEASRGQEVETIKRLRSQLEEVQDGLRQVTRERDRLAHWREENEPELERLRSELAAAQKELRRRDNELKIRRRYDISEFLGEKEQRALKKLMEERPSLKEDD